MNEPKPCVGFPVYPKTSAGLMELNVCVRRAGEAYPKEQIDDIRDLLEGEYGLTAWAVDDETEGYLDLKYEIGNGIAVDLVPDFVALRHDVPDLWEICSFLVEDEVQVFLLEKHEVPRWNYDYDTMMGGDGGDV